MVNRGKSGIGLPGHGRVKHHAADQWFFTWFFTRSSMLHKPHAPSCDRNREPILAVLRSQFADRHAVLEVGSGTGQHAVYFAQAMPQLVWQTSEVADNLPAIRLWLDEAQLPNTPAPLELDVTGAWPALQVDAVFTANTLHIMSWTEVQCLFTQLPQVLTADAKLAIYGAFNYGGQFTSTSNAEFDAWLRSRASHMGIRDMEAVNALAEAIGFQLLDDLAMPANNRLLIWQRR